MQLRLTCRLRLGAIITATSLLLARGQIFAQWADAFAPNANVDVYAIAVQPDGGVVLGGAFTTLGGVSRSHLGRVTADGKVDPDFNPAPNGIVSGLAVQPNGKIIIAGNFGSLGTLPAVTFPRSGIARLNSDGSPDVSFDAGMASYVYTLAVQADGKILVGGSFTTLGGLSRSRIARLNADGTPDTNFVASASGTVTTIAIQPDGKILVGGSFTQLDGVARNYIGRLNADGTLDLGFNPGASAAVNTLLLQPDGNILVGSSFSPNSLVRLDSTGSFDSAFSPQLGGIVYSLALQANGQILVGGSFSSVGGQPRANLARLNADGTLDDSFNPGANGAVDALALQPDGQVLVGGAFGTLAGQARSRIGRLKGAGTASQTLSFGSSGLLWQPGGASPEFTRVTFELTTNGIDWVGLAPVNYTPNGWQVANPDLPANYAIRARGYVSGGEYNGSSWSVLAAMGVGPVIIVEQPLNQKVSVGGQAGFRVTASGTPPLTYQWRKNGLDIPGATDASFVIGSAASADSGTYSVGVANGFGEVSSRAATLTILHTNMPQAATQPPGPVSEAGATLNGMAVPRGYPTLAWFEWGTNLDYGFATPPVDLDSGVQVVRVSTPIEGLASGGVYHYRIVASNAFSMVWGPDTRFTTGMPLATWGDYSQGYPAMPAGLSNIVAVGSGHGHSLALGADGTLVAWRTGYYPFVGQTTIPAGLSNVVGIAGGYTHTMALLGDGTVVSWGRYMISSLPVTPPPGLSNVVAVAGGDSHSLALVSNGKVIGWGDNSSGQISVPASASNVVAIAAGSTHSLALRADGKVIAWGNSFGASATPPAWLSNVVAISAEAWHNLALRADGTVVAWGYNGSGQTTVPGGLGEVVAVSAGFQHSIALKADGTVVAWGSPYYVTNVPASVSQVVGISSSDYDSVALTPVNLPPRAFLSSATGSPGRDLVVTLYGWDPNADPLHFRISSPPSRGSLYQYAAGTRGDLINSPETPVTDPLGRVVFVPLPDTFGVAYDSFGVVASDASLDSPAGRTTVNIVPSPSIETATWVQSTNPGFALSFTGLTNASYSVQTSTDCTNWAWVGAPTQALAGQFFFLDSAATNKPQRFYRVRSP